MKHSPYFNAGVAAAYDRLAVPLQFMPAASDLISMLSLTPGSFVLDIGAGTGAVAIPASLAVGSDGMVVAVDPSVEMLRVLRRKTAVSVVAAQAPGLPFRDGLFHAALASFVVSHIRNYREALADMVRVLRPRGHLGVTSWGTAVNPVVQLWKNIAAEFVSLDRLQEAFRGLIPWEEWFSGDANLRQALEDARLVSVEVTRREYLLRMGITDCLSLRENSVEGTLLRQMLSAEEWTAFSQCFADALQSRFAEIVEYVRDVYFGIGMKPDTILCK